MYLAAKSSGRLTTDQIVITGPGRLSGLQIDTDSTNNTLVILYDNTEASGTELARIEVVGANLYGGRNFTVPVEFTNGVYLDIDLKTGAGGTIIETCSP